MDEKAAGTEVLKGNIILRDTGQDIVGGESITNTHIMQNKVIGTRTRSMKWQDGHRFQVL